MAKIKQPLLSLDASRKLGDELVYGHRQKANIVQVKPMPSDARSVGQLSWRHMFQKVVALWHALSAAEKEAWESLGRKRHMTGYAWFISQALRPNPGIYLPLQGGTMAGDIDMAKHRLLKLPAPTDDQEAANKEYVDDTEPATKEFSVPCTGISHGASWSQKSKYPVARLVSSGQRAYTFFVVPHDYSSMINASLVVIPLFTVAAALYHIYSNYAGNGEHHNINSEWDAATTYNVTNNQFFEIPLAGILTALSAGDRVGIMLFQAHSSHDVDCLGVRFRYA